MATWIDKIVALTTVGKAYKDRKVIAEAQAKRDALIQAVDDELGAELFWYRALKILDQDIKNGQT